MTKVKAFKTDNQDYLHSPSIGYAVRTRVEHSIQNGLLVYDKDTGDYMFTKKAMTYTNYFAWLQGHDDRLTEREVVF